MEYFFDEIHYNKLYNCSTYKVEDLPLEMRQKPLLGWTMLAFFTISEIFYVPCLIAIWGHLSQSCYKIMFFIGLTDVCALWVCGFLSGFFALRGDVFCSHPTLIYIAGMFGEMFWGMESIAATLLAANRCILLGMPRLGEFLFDGWRTWFWLLLTFLYSFWYGFFTKSQLFSSVTFTWFFNPHVGYIEGIDDLYANIVDTINSAFVACTISGFYLTFAALLVLKRKQSSSNPNDGAKIIFLQVFILSSMNAIAGTCYVLMAIIQFPDWVGYLGTFMWAFCHGIPPVIYLGINRTLRNDCARMFGLKNGVVGQQQIKNNNNLIVSNTQNSNIQNNNNITPVNA